MRFFSFWKQIGNPNIRNNFVVGREIREGCIMPTKAGGICQLSNALYDTALKANFNIIERHKHTQVIKGSLAEKDRDATVKWNYIDLRFSAPYKFRIETELTSSNLIVRFKSISKQNTSKKINNLFFIQSNDINDCVSCHNIDCNYSIISDKLESNNKTFILDECWTEYDNYLQDKISKNDVVIIPVKKNLLINTNRYNWTINNTQNIIYTSFEGIYRALKLRMNRHNNVFEEQLKLDKLIAEKASKLIPLNTTHLIISQNLLPFIYESGALGGRTYDVLMVRNTFEKIHHSLDQAHKTHPSSKTLNDFRASDDLINLENKALENANSIISPHSDIQSIYPQKSINLKWNIIENGNSNHTNNKVLFPAGGFGRKGAYEIRRLAKELNLDIVLYSNAKEDINFWDEVSTSKFTDFKEIGLIIYPTYIEHQPRVLLKALSFNIPIITTPSSGLKSSELVEIIPIGDYQILKNITEKYIYN